MTSHDPDILYPALLLGKDSVYLAHDPLELCAHPRSLFDDTVRSGNKNWLSTPLLGTMVTPFRPVTTCRQAIRADWCRCSREPSRGALEPSGAVGFYGKGRLMQVVFNVSH